MNDRAIDRLMSASERAKGDSMVDAAIKHELSACMNELAVEQQRQVLEFARTLTLSPVSG